MWIDTVSQMHGSLDAHHGKQMHISSHISVCTCEPQDSGTSKMTPQTDSFQSWLVHVEYKMIKPRIIRMNKSKLQSRVLTHIHPSHWKDPDSTVPLNSPRITEKWGIVSSNPRNKTARKCLNPVQVLMLNIITGIVKQQPTKTKQGKKQSLQQHTYWISKNVKQLIFWNSINVNNHHNNDNNNQGQQPQQLSAPWRPLRPWAASNSLWHPHCSTPQPGSSPSCSNHGATMESPWLVGWWLNDGHREMVTVWKTPATRVELWSIVNIPFSDRVSRIHTYHQQVCTI